MNIAIFSDTYLPTINGVSTSTKTFADIFFELGHSVFLFVPKVKKEKDQTIERISGNVFKIFRFSALKFPLEKEQRIAFMMHRILPKFKSLKIDIIQSQTPFTMGLLAYLLAKRHKIPMVHVYHTFYEEYLYYLKLSKRITLPFCIKISKSFCNNSQLVVVPSKEMKEGLIDYDVKTPIEIIPTGVDMSYIIRKMDPDIVINNGGFHKNKRIMSFVGRLGKEKSVDFLLRCFTVISKRINDTELVIIGDGNEKENLEKLSKKLGIQDKVHFLGMLEPEKVFAYYAISELFLFPSITETQGLVTLEAQALGVPVVGINKMGTADVMKNEIGGLLCEEADENEFIKNTIRLLTDKQLYDRKKQEAIQNARQWSSEFFAGKMIAKYEQVINSYKK